MTSRNKREGYFVPGCCINLKPNYQKVNVRTGAGNGIVRYRSQQFGVFFWPCKASGVHSANKGSWRNRK